MVNHRTAVVSQIRGLLLDRGFAMAKSITRASQWRAKRLPNFMILCAISTTGSGCSTHSSEPCQRIAKIEGVGPKTATAIVAAIGDGAEFKNGRHLAA